MSSLKAVSPAAAAGGLKVLTTALQPTSQQFDFYRAGMLRRVLPTVRHPKSAFRARMRLVVGRSAELVEHRSDSVDVERSAQRLRGDGCDDISIDLMRLCATCAISQGGDRVLRSGELCFIDYGQPLSMIRSRHIANGIIVSRARVREAVGSDVSSLVGKPIPKAGLASVLSRHLVTTFDEAGKMSASERAAATDAAVEMMLALLRTRLGRTVDEDGFPAGFYQAARIAIERHCTDPDLTPGRVAAIVGCSRASLYRAFANHEETVAHAIWIARLERALQLLTSCRNGEPPVSDIAWRCGFRQPASFTRMFRRHYGFSPSDARVPTFG